MRKTKKLRFVHLDLCFVSVVETEKEMENCIGVKILRLFEIRCIQVSQVVVHPDGMLLPLGFVFYQTRIPMGCYGTAASNKSRKDFRSVKQTTSIFCIP